MITAIVQNKTYKDLLDVATYDPETEKTSSYSIEKTDVIQLYEFIERQRHQLLRSQRERGDEK